MLGDKNRLKQIFKNVIDNAIKYSHKDGKVFVNLTQKEGQAVINTKDQGGGIGLAIVKEIVELHDGTVSIVSKEEMGTVILIKFPL
ncbi:ATP-binding protein [Bacillus mycoides]|uniref:ATP-binding protein n=1 Tax=Bacillus mycoides TaxID=1405 RepID=UPI002EB0F2E4|nr:ATP-binding protein [Bacillus mycoides]